MEEIGNDKNKPYVIISQLGAVITICHMPTKVPPQYQFAARVFYFWES